MPKTPVPLPAPSPEDRRRARKRSRRETTREEILAAARAVVLSKGIAGATLEAVAQEAGMSKTALYYYFASKDALLFELVFGIISRLAQNTQDAVDLQADGPGALEALIATTLSTFEGRLDDFRLAYLQSQMGGPGTVKIDEEHLQQVRPLNTQTYAGTAERLAATGPNRAGVDPRLMAFLAQVSVIGILTMKGMVESIDDPLVYSDEQMINALTAIFATAAEPAERR